jgi:ATP phosphoribosyltransferase
MQVMMMIYITNDSKGTFGGKKFSLIENIFGLHDKMTSANDSAAKKRMTPTSIAEEDDLLTFAIPKKGRLYEQCVDLLKGCGLRYTRNPRLDIAYVTGPLKLKLVFLPAADIPKFVGVGDVDLGLTGQDMVAETFGLFEDSSATGELDVKDSYNGNHIVIKQLLKTEFGICELAVQAPKVKKLVGPEALSGKRLATSFPNLTSEFFSRICKEKGLPQPSIRTISGSVEAACGLGLADGVVDLVETGATMEEAGLEKIGVVLKTQAVLIANPKSHHHALIETIRKRIEGYLFAKKFSMMCKCGKPFVTKYAY